MFLDWHRRPQCLTVQDRHFGHGKHLVATEKERKNLKTGGKASASGYQERSSVIMYQLARHLHHPRRDPSKINQETPIAGCEPEASRGTASFQKSEETIFTTFFKLEILVNNDLYLSAISLCKLCRFC